MVGVTSSQFVGLNSKRLTITVVSLLALAGVLLILYVTAIAPWGFSDSAAYINTARNIAAGRGIVLQDSNNVYNLLPFHAPLYPLTLSLPITLGLDAVQASRWLNAILYGLTILLAGLATHWFTRSFWLSTGAAALCLLSYEPLLAYTSLMAEGLSTFFGFLSLFLIALAISRLDGSSKLLVAAGVSGGLAILARYTGIAVLIAGSVSIFMLIKGDFKTRLKQALMFTLPASILAALWLVPVYLSTGTFGSRQVGEVAGLADKVNGYFSSFMEIIGGWLPFFYRGNHIITPGQKLVLAALLLIVLIVVTVRNIHKEGQPFNENGSFYWAAVLGIYVAAYIGLHSVTYVIAAERPDINGRLLLPIFYAGVLLAAVTVSFISRNLSRRWVGGLAFTALVLLTLWYFHSKVQWFVFEMNHYGQGYTSNRWNENPIFDRIATLDDRMILYSNDPALVLFYTGRHPKELIVDQDRTSYAAPVTSGAGLILFTGTARKDLGENYSVFVDSMKSDYQIYYEDNEGLIFTAQPP